MKVIRSVELMQAEMMKVRQKEVGFVPTMGFFHNGHTSLMDEAKKENDIVVTSIFVNPLQFGPNEDFVEYPRDEEHDIKKAEEHGVDILFVPDVKSMYPQKMSVIMKSESRVNILCGRSRPDRKSTRLNSSHVAISYAVFCLKKKNNNKNIVKGR